METPETEHTLVIDEEFSEEAPKKRGRPKKEEAAEKRTKIWLEENDDIPPTGLGIGHNGKIYLLRPGMEAEVPAAILEILDHAVMSAPVTDPQTKRVIGYRDRLRYPYRRLS